MTAVSIEAEVDAQIKALRRGVADVIGAGTLRKKIERSLQTEQPLTVKLGLDPSAPDIHLGHTVVLRKLRQFQDLGHRVVLIIGDFTGRIGDPTGRSETRTQLTAKEVQENAQTYEQQVFKVLQPEKTEVRFNRDWLGELDFEDVINLASSMTVARMLERESFSKRYRNQQPVYIHEFFYPLMQGYDSVAVEADVELGGTDQRFNLVTARDIQRSYGQEPQAAILMPLIEGTDGVNKMSKSLGNYIGIDEPTSDIYGKAMSISDELIVPYMELTTDLSMDEIDGYRQRLKDQETNPRDIKMVLAHRLVAMYHGSAAADRAQAEFERVFKQGRLPDAPETALPADQEGRKLWIVRLLKELQLVESHSQARRMIKQGAVRLNGEKVTDVDTERVLPAGTVVQVGKKRSARIIYRE